MEEKSLEQIGLSPNEIKVYLALLDLGSCQAGKICEKAEIHRRATYDALNRLIKKGLASFVIQNNVKYYEAIDPEKLKDILSEKEKALEKERGDLDNVLHILLSKYNSNKSSLEASIYRGKDGLKTIMELILKERKDWLSIGSTGKGPEVLPYYLIHWHKRRIKDKVWLKSLVVNDKEGIKRGKEFLEIGLAKVKVLPKNIQSPQTIWIFGNKVAIILVSIEQPVIFLINNKEIAKSFRDYFNLLWAKVSQLNYVV